MTLKCWTSTGAIGQAPPPDAATGVAASASVSASTAGASSAAVATMPAPVSILAPAPRSAPPPSLSHIHTGGLHDMRRRSVGFINTTAIAESAASPLVTTPSRNPNVHKPNNRMRSLSSTWEATDIDDDDDAAEEKTSSSYTEISRRDLMFTSIASNLNHSGNQVDGNGNQTPRRRGGHHSRSARSRRRRTMSESSGSATNGSRRVRILTPVGSKVCFGGWVRGQPAEVRWEVVDKTVQSVRIDVCNVAWSVPTTIASRVPNDGNFQWKRVYWGMPITDGYYVNIYDVTDVSPEQLPSPDQQQSRPADQPSLNQSNGSTPSRPEKSELVLLARSDCFAVIG